MKYFLTDKAPKEAIESYNEFYEEDDFDICSQWVMSEIIKDTKAKLKQEGKSDKEIEEEIKKSFGV